MPKNAQIHLRKFQKIKFFEFPKMLVAQKPPKKLKTTKCLSKSSPAHPFEKRLGGMMENTQQKTIFGQHFLIF